MLGEMRRGGFDPDLGKSEPPKVATADKPFEAPPNPSQCSSEVIEGAVRDDDAISLSSEESSKSSEDSQSASRWDDERLNELTMSRPGAGDTCRHLESHKIHITRCPGALILMCGRPLSHKYEALSFEEALELPKEDWCKDCFG
eukprot:7049773-Karenia_brevis.AAC.1